jgi:O-antigen/teichoic acid export membrane protein
MKNLLIYFFGEGISRALAFLSSLMMAYFLTPEEFGELAMIFIMAEICLIFVSNNANAKARVRYFKTATKDFEATVVADLGNSVLIAFVAFFLCMWVDAMSFSLQVFLILAVLFRVPGQIMMVEKQCTKSAKKYTILNLTFALVNFLSISFFVKYGISVSSWVFAYLLASISQYTIVISWDKKYSLFKGLKSGLNKSEFRGGLMYLPMAISWSSKIAIERFTISYSVGLGELGTYAFAYQMASIVVILAQILNIALYPEIASRLKVRVSPVRIILLAIPVLILTATLVFVATKWLLLSSDFSKFASSWDYFTLMLASALVQGIALIVFNIIYILDREGNAAMIVIGVFLLQPIVYIILFSSSVVTTYSVAFVSFCVVAVLLSIISIRAVHLMKNYF